MTMRSSRNTKNTLDMNDVLDALDSLQRQHRDMLNDMQGHSDSHEILRPAVKTEESVSPSDVHIADQEILAEPDTFKENFQLHLDSPEPSKEPMILEGIIRKYLTQEVLLSEPDSGLTRKEASLKDVKDIFSTSQNETTSPGALPAFRDIGSFDPSEPKAGRLKKQSDIDTPPKKSKSKVRRFISAALFYGFLLCLIGGAFLISQGNKKPVFGYYFMNVLTWSMQSEIPQSSMVAVRQVDPNTIEIGDDITYMKDAETSVTHRVIGFTENYEGSGERGFETQGIENDTPDFEIVPAVNVVGKVVFHIPMLGGWLQWLREHLVVTIFFTAGFILLIILLKGAFKKSPEESKKHSPQSRRFRTDP